MGKGVGQLLLLWSVLPYFNWLSVQLRMARLSGQ